MPPLTPLTPLTPLPPLPHPLPLGGAAPAPIPSGDPEMLREMARWIRIRTIQMSHAARAPHLASALSCIDMLVAAYWGYLKIDPANPGDAERDRMVFSKGHAAIGLYATLAHRGIIPMDLLDDFGKEGGGVGEQPIPFAVPGVEAATGSLGHGLSLGIGMAMAARIDKKTYRTLVLVSDGECNEGSVWEAAMMAAGQKLSNLTVMVDFNRWQATGRSQEIMALDPLAEKWRAFGWDTMEVDGHDIPALIQALNHPNATGCRAIVAHTVKGRGVSFMQDDNNWHYRIPGDQDLAAAMKELGG